MNEANQKLLDQIIDLRKENHDFRAIKKKVGEDRLREFISAIYPKFAITEIEDITGIPDSTLGHWFELLDIPSIRSHIKNISIPGSINAETVITKEGVTLKVVTIDITPELAYVIGFTLGDGSVQQYMIEVFNKDSELKEVLFNYLKPYGTIKEEERENGLWRLRLSNGRIANIIKNNTGIRKDTLDYIFNNDKLTKQFIAAFWDAEGSVLKQSKYFHVYLYNSNRDLLHRVSRFLQSKKIKHSIITVSGPSIKERTYYYKGKPIISKKDIFRIGIPKSDVTKWANEIGLHLKHSKKKEMVKKMLENVGGKIK